MSRQKEPLDAAEIERLWKECFAGDAQQALSSLCALCRDSRAAELINGMPDRRSLDALLSSQKPKVRKNAARLIGEIMQPNDVSSLLRALENEKTYFVAPSIILALGNSKSAFAPDAIRAFVDALPPDAEEKQREEITQAAQTALSRLIEREHPEFTGLDRPRVFLLTSACSCSRAIMDEAAEKGVKADLQQNGVLLQSDDYGGLFKLRCFDEALIRLCRAESREPEKIAAAIAKSDVMELAARYSAAPQYRLEVRNAAPQEKTEIIAAVKKAVPLVNSPSSYDMELRIEPDKSGAQVYVKLYIPKDPRFAYRKGSISASISPSTAASIMRLSKKYLKPDGRALDPCCGSGTLLIERARLMPHGELVGVDIDMEALRVARENVKASGEKIALIGGDLRKFKPDAPFDELFANLPFGSRVGSKSSNTQLYSTLVSRLDELLKPDGTAFLYTTQLAPLERLLEKSGWGTAEKIRLEAGGLLPYLVTVRKK